MRPSAFFDVMSTDTILNGLGVNANTIAESQSEDERPFNTGLFVIFSFEESSDFNRAINRGPRTMTVAIHRSWDETRNYDDINRVLNRIDELILPFDNVVGSDGVRVSQVQRRFRSGNQTDEGWRTITRWQTYGVLYDELAV